MPPSACGRLAAAAGVRRAWARARTMCPAMVALGAGALPRSTYAQSSIGHRHGLRGKAGNFMAGFEVALIGGGDVGVRRGLSMSGVAREALTKHHSTSQSSPPRLHAVECGVPKLLYVACTPEHGKTRASLQAVYRGPWFCPGKKLFKHLTPHSASPVTESSCGRNEKVFTASTTV